MGEFFTSFHDAWAAFLAREEALEDFYAQFPDDPEYVLTGWLVEPSAEVKAAAAGIQDRLSHLSWLVPIPEHFLHVWLGAQERIGDVWRSWGDVSGFTAAYGRVNCFHSAVVIEADPAFRQLVAGTPNDVPEFLPHLTVAVVREPASPDALREALLPLRESTLGKDRVSEVQLVSFPAARTTLFRPWTVERRVALDEA